MTPITAEEFRDAVIRVSVGEFDDPSMNQDSPYEVSLPFSDWKSIYERLKDLEDAEIILDEMAKRYQENNG